MSENQEAKNGVSPQEKVPKKEDHETWEVQPQGQEEQEEDSGEPITPKKLVVLQRDLTTLVTNIQTAADAKESIRRTELEEARRIRLERLENDAKASQEKFEEITRGWLVAKEKVIPQELQEALNSQQLLCAAIIEDKKKLINELQQELKASDERFVKDLRKQEEQLDLMMERIGDQIRTQTKAYREELAQIESIYQQEYEVLLLTDKSEWEQDLKELWDEELERLAHRHKKVEEFEEIIHNSILETTDKFNLYETENEAQLQALTRELQQAEATKIVADLKKNKLKHEEMQHKSNLANVKSRFSSLKTEQNKLKAKQYGIKEQFTKKTRCLSEEYKRNVEQYERLQKKIKPLAVADARKFEQMWLTVEEEVKQLVERVLVIDMQICRHFGLAWQRPPMAFMELSGPIQPQKQPGSPARQTASQQFDNRQASQCESGAEVEEGKTETLKKVMELLCDETGFLVEDKLLNLLAPLEKEEQTVLKLASLLSTFNIEVEDVPSLAEFLLKNAHEQREQTEDVCVDSSEVETHLTSELINPNRILPALKSFLEQHLQSRESSAHEHHSFHVEARDTSEDKAYWESMGNIISEDKLKFWDAAENTLKQHLAVLTEISELVPETQSLEQQNTELKMLLHGILKSGVSTELETP